MTRKRRSRRAPPPTASRKLEALSTRLERWLPVLLVIITAVVFLQTPSFAFVHWDDHNYVFDNPFYQPVSLRGIAHFWTAAYHGLYAPVTFTVHGLQALLLGLHGGRFHAVSLLVHAVNVALVYGLVRRLLHLRGATAAPILAAGGALLFAVHPIQVESVAWVTGMKELLSTLFALLALRAYFARKDAASTTPNRPFLLGTVWFVLALLSKPTTVVLGPVAAVLDVSLLGTTWRRALQRVWPWLAIGAPFALVAKRLQPDALLETTAPLWLRPFVAMDALQFYAVRLLAPHGFTPDHGRTPQWLLESGAWRWSWIVPALILAGAGWAAYRRRFAPLGLVAAVGLALLPVLGLVPFPMQNWSTVTDHYVYLPFALVGLAVSLLLAETPAARRHLALAAVAVVAVALAAMSMSHMRIWRSDDTLFPYALQRNPDSVILRMNYAESLYIRGRHEETLEQLRAAAGIRPTAGVYSNIGAVLVELRRYEEARAAFQEALALDPEDEDVRHNLAVLAELEAQHGRE